MGDNDRLSNIIDGSMAAVVGIIMIAAVVIPIAVSQINSLTSSVAGDDWATYQSLLSVVIILTIVGLIIGIVKHFSGSSSRE